GRGLLPAGARAGAEGAAGRGGVDHRRRRQGRAHDRRGQRPPGVPPLSYQIVICRVVNPAVMIGDAGVCPHLEVPCPGVPPLSSPRRSPSSSPSPAARRPTTQIATGPPAV